MIYVTHDQGEALALGDRVAVMDRGRVVQVGHAARGLRAARPRGSSRGFVGNPPMSVDPLRRRSGRGPARVSSWDSTGVAGRSCTDWTWPGPTRPRRGEGRAGPPARARAARRASGRPGTESWPGSPSTGRGRAGRVPGARVGRDARLGPTPVNARDSRRGSGPAGRRVRVGVDLDAPPGSTRRRASRSARVTGADVTARHRVGRPDSDAGRSLEIVAALAGRLPRQGRSR